MPRHGLPRRDPEAARIGSVSGWSVAADSSRETPGTPFGASVREATNPDAHLRATRFQTVIVPHAGEMRPRIREPQDGNPAGSVRSSRAFPWNQTLSNDSVRGEPANRSSAIAVSRPWVLFRGRPGDFEEA